MKKLLPTLCAAAGIFTAAMTSAQAQEFGNMDVSFSANIGVTNNYVWRGQTQTDDGPAVQGGVDAEFDNGLSFGAWASNVDFGDNTTAELDLYGSFAIPINDMMSANIGGIAYLYPGQPSGADSNFFEFNGGFDFDLGGPSLSTSVAFSPYVGGETTFYWNAGLGVPLGEYLEVFGGLGYYTWEVSGDVVDYNFGIAATLENFTVSTYYAGAGAPGNSGSVVVMLTAAIP